MPILKAFSEELLTTDMVYGTSKGIDSMYEVYKMKNVHVDRCNKGADFATTEKVANSGASLFATRASLPGYFLEPQRYIWLCR